MARSSGPFITGKVGFVTVVATGGGAPALSLPATNITVSGKADLPDVSNAISGGFVETVSGVKEAEISCDVAYDPALVTGFYAGQKVDVRINPTGNNPAANPEYPVSAIVFAFELCTITSVKYNVAAKDAQKVSLTMKTTGSYSFMIVD